MDIQSRINKVLFEDSQISPSQQHLGNALEQYLKEQRDSGFVFQYKITELTDIDMVYFTLNYGRFVFWCYIELSDSNFHGTDCTSMSDYKEILSNFIFATMLIDPNTGDEISLWTIRFQNDRSFTLDFTNVEVSEVYGDELFDSLEGHDEIIGEAFRESLLNLAQEMSKATGYELTDYV